MDQPPETSSSCWNRERGRHPTEESTRNVHETPERTVSSLGASSERGDLCPAYPRKQAGRECCNGNGPSKQRKTLKSQQTQTACVCFVLPECVASSRALLSSGTAGGQAAFCVFPFCAPRFKPGSACTRESLARS